MVESALAMPKKRSESENNGVPPANHLQKQRSPRTQSTRESSSSKQRPINNYHGLQKSKSTPTIGEYSVQERGKEEQREKKEKKGPFAKLFGMGKSKDGTKVSSV